jgi:excisionase family DNA binding protein
MALVNVEEAALQLGVSPRRVRKMLADSLIPGVRIGRAWGLEERHIDRFKDHRAPIGRPWSASSAWAALAMADGNDSILAPVERSRARRRMSGRGFLGVVDRLAARAERGGFYGHPSVLRRLANEPSLILSGVSAAAAHRADVRASEFLEAYVPLSQAQGIIRRYALRPVEERPNIVLRIVEDSVWPFAGGDRMAPRAVVAVDLLESDDERSRRAGSELARRPQ